MDFFGNPDLTNLTVGGIIVLVLGLLLSIGFFFASRYRRCPANQLLVISGKTGERDQTTGEAMPRVVSGGGTFVWPVLQEYAYLDLTPFTLKIELPDALSAETIRVSVPSAFTLAIGNTSPLKEAAAIRLLGKQIQEIRSLAGEVIIGQLRQVIALMSISEINSNRDDFRRKIEQTLVPELTKLGLVLLNVNIQDLRDESGYLTAIGRKAASEATQRALGDVAEAEREGRIRVATAEQDQNVRVAEQQRLQTIGVRDAEVKQAMALAELERNEAVQQQQQRALKDAEIAEAERQRRIALAEANAQAVQGETVSSANIAEAEATLAVKRAEAEQRSNTAAAVASAAVAKASAEAQTAAALAEAARVEATERAKLEAPAKAQKATAIVNAQAQAEQTVLRAEAEATAMQRRLEAEAEGQYALLSKRAEGLKQLVEAAGSAEQAFALLLVDMVPSLVEKAAEAVKGVKVDKVMVWDSGTGAPGEGGVSRYTRDLMRTVPPALDLVEQVTGIKLPALGRDQQEQMLQALANAMGPDGMEALKAKAATMSTATVVPKAKSAATPDAKDAADATDGNGAARGRAPAER